MGKTLRDTPRSMYPRAAKTDGDWKTGLKEAQAQFQALSQAEEKPPLEAESTTAQEAQAQREGPVSEWTEFGNDEPHGYSPNSANFQRQPESRGQDQGRPSPKKKSGARMTPEGGVHLEVDLDGSDLAEARKTLLLQQKADLELRKVQIEKEKAQVVQIQALTRNDKLNWWGTIATVGVSVVGAVVGGLTIWAGVRAASEVPLPPRTLPPPLPLPTVKKK